MVSSSDLAEVLGAWGPARVGAAADLDGSGEVDAIDLAILIGSWGACPAPCLKTLVVGSVQRADGTPVADAVIVTELGGQGVSDQDGAFRFEVELLPASESLTVTAIASNKGTTLKGTKLVSPIAFDGVTDAGVIGLSASTGCAGEFGWLPGFGLPGLSSVVYATTVFDDGSGGGPALYVGGNFLRADGVAVNGIAKWNGTSWSSLGTGPANGMGGVAFAVHALTVFDDGSGGGPALYAGGEFTTAGGATANRIAKWDGVSWSSLGTGSANGMSSTVFALTVFDDGSGGGPALYAGGLFTTAGGASANRIAKWNGVSWSSLGTGLAGSAPFGLPTVFALTVFDADSSGGPELYVGGDFTTAGGVTANRIAKWNGTTWSSLGTGSTNGVDDSVRDLTVFDDGSGGGPALYAGGLFTTAGGASATRIAKWSGTEWSSLGTGSGNGADDSVYALIVFDDGSGGGSSLYAGGWFLTAGGAVSNHIAKWNGNSWSPLGAFSSDGADSSIFTLTVFDDGSGGGPALYAGGAFLTAGDVQASRVAKWDGTSWVSLGTGSENGLNDWVYVLTVFDDGSGGGPALYAGGAFTTAGGVPASKVAKWDGTSWSPLGTGSANGTNDTVFALTVFDDGSGGGQALYAGGQFTTAGGVTANRIAKWSGAAWSPVGTGPAIGVNNSVRALTVFDDGSGNGPELYLGGEFTTAGGATANRIVKWNGKAWSSLGRGSMIGLNNIVRALTVFDDGSGDGPALYVGGEFTTAGGAAANRIARWDGTSWSSLGTGATNGVGGGVRTLTVFDDGSGSGSALYAGGSFTTAGGVPANRIAKWNGASWSPLGTGSTNGASDTVVVLTVFDDGSSGGPALYAGGAFKQVGDLGSSFFAKWGCDASQNDTQNK